MCKRSGISSPPPSQKNLFGDADGSEEDLKAEEIKKLQQSLSRLTDELEGSRSLMDLKFAELQAREENLQSIIQGSVQKALENYIASNPLPAVPVPAPTAERTANTTDALSTSPVHDCNSAIQMICGSVNILDRLVSRYSLPDMFKEKKVATIFDMYYRSIKKYEKLQDNFIDASDGAELILAIRKFRDLFSAYCYECI